MPTSIQLIEMDGVSQRAESVRFDLLDRTGTKIGQVHPDEKSQPSIQNDGTRTIKRTMQNMTLEPSDVAAIDTLNERLRVVWVFGNGDEYAVGGFMWGDASRTRNSWGIEMHATMVDRGFLVDQKVRNSTGYEAGRLVTDALMEQALLAGFTAADIDITPSTTAIGATGYVAAPNTSRAQIMSDLCALTGYYDWYLSNADVLTCRPAVDSTVVAPTLNYNAGTTNSGRIIDTTISEADDLLSAPNTYIAIANVSANGEVVATYTIPDSAPNSVKNRGFVIPEIVELSALDGNDDALAAAKAKYEQGRTAYRWVDFEAVADPRHDTYDIVGYLGDTYREASWTLALATGGTMQHSLRRVYS